MNNYYLQCKTLREYINYSIEYFGNETFLCEVDGDKLTYDEVFTKIKTMIATFKSLNIQKGEKIAIIGPNSINWAISFLSILYYGAVAVPILPDFSFNSIINILNLSESKAVFLNKYYLDIFEINQPKFLEYAFSLENLQLIDISDKFSIDKQIFNNINNFLKKADTFIKTTLKKEQEIKPDDLASLVYTSGTTGVSKGVLLTHKNILSSIKGGLFYVDPEIGKERFLSVLPLAHTYESSLGLLAPMSFGASIYYVTQRLGARVLLQAFQKVKPTMMFAVPLIMEKIYKTKIKKKFESNMLLKALVSFPITRKILYKKAADQLHKTLGGELKHIGFGGAPIHPEVERFMYEGNFPYHVGYGMTECAPLIAGSKVTDTKLYSCGYATPEAKIRIYNPDPKTGIGEIQTKGDMVFSGYFNNKEATEKIFTKDGWLKTGDLAKMDKHGYIYIKGRLKNIILGPSGENIYPEEIEQLLDSDLFVIESLVIQRQSKLIALIYPDIELIFEKNSFYSKDQSHVKEWINDYFQKLIDKINVVLPNFSKISEFKLVEEEFEKTPTKKIKRFLYQ